MHALKIDRSFITHLLDEPTSRRSCARSSSWRGTCGSRRPSGVEDERVCDRLVGLGCDYAQGFALARLMPADAMRSWLRARVTVD